MVPNYGIQLPPNTRPPNALELELHCFSSDRQPDVGGLGAYNHLSNVISILWGDWHKKIWGNKPLRPFNINPWAERSLRAACQHKVLAVLGCANSSKTTTFAVYAICRWLADPLNTVVLVTSTSLKDSRRRIWGKITEYFTAHPGLPGKLVDSEGKIRAKDEATGKYVDTAGISIIAGDRKKEKEAIGKMIGIKAKKIVLIADELPELSPAIIAAFFSNLAVNPYAQLIGIGNFNSILDPLGEMSKPAEGWDAITPEDDEWETEKGFCIRFDGLKSPNITSGIDDYPEIYTNRNLAQHRVQLGGENTALFWRMCRSFPCPEADSNVIYSEADFIRGRVFERPQWDGTPVKIAGLDPSFSAGGDRFPMAIGWYGKNAQGDQQVALDRIVVLREDLSMRDKPREFQLLEQVRDIMREERIAIENLGFDASGPAGLAFGSILINVIGYGALPVKFGGKASSTAIGYDDSRTGEECFKNRRSEIWSVGRDPLRRGQIKGLTAELAREMRLVTYKTEKTDKVRMMVEPKDEMKKRLGVSPDLADAFFIMLDVSRQRHGFNLMVQGTETVNISEKSFDVQLTDANLVYENANYSTQLW